MKHGNHLACIAALAWLANGCGADEAGSGDSRLAPGSTPQTPTAAPTSSPSAPGSPGSESPPPLGSVPAPPGSGNDAPDAPPLDTTAELVLHGAPLIFNPTANSFEINVVVSHGDPAKLQASVRGEGQADFAPLPPPSHRASSIAEWKADDLSAGTRYDYRITSLEPERTGEVLFEGSAITQRPPGQEFSFTIITDTHVPQPVDTAQRDQIEQVYQDVMRDVTQLEQPDFIVNLGDLLDFHLYGFNAPPLLPQGSRDAYMNYRSLMGPILGNAAQFTVIGNWEGENGCFSPDVIDRSLSQRLLYMPGPEPTTYPEGGNINEDYYAFQWGDALFVVLNVMTYTTTCHELSTLGGTPDDWTLGHEQLEWFENTLAQATSRWRFVLIHHVVGGAAGNQANSNYGRGGGQSAYIGEQALVHELMRESGVQIFFYGHDHVFTDMVVDDIHYTLPGSAGAPWKFVTSETGYVNYWPESGYGRVHVSPESVQVDFVAQGGIELYSYRIPDPEHVSLNEPPRAPGEAQRDAGAGPTDAGSMLDSSIDGATPGPEDARFEPADAMPGAR